MIFNRALCPLGFLQWQSDVLLATENHDFGEFKSIHAIRIQHG